MSGSLEKKDRVVPKASCGTPRAPVTFPSFSFGFIVGLCSNPPPADFPAFTDLARLMSTGVTCLATGLSADWDFLKVGTP